MKTTKLLSFLTAPLIILSACSSSEDSNGAQTQRIVEITRSWSGGAIETINVEYSDSGNYLRDITRQNGEITFVRNFETTADGQFIRRSDDNNQDGVEDSASTYEYTNGLGLSRVHRLDSNMFIDTIEVFRFENGVVVSAEARDIDDVATPDLIDESSGTVTARFNYKYEGNQLIEKTTDSNDDGIADQLEVFNYNPDGTLASTTRNSVTEGAINSSVYVYEQGACNSNFTNTIARYYCVTVD